jgi:hypothetical protein
VLVLGMIMLMGTHKPTTRTYLIRDPFLETSIFTETVSQDRFKLTLNLSALWTVNSQDTHTDPKLFIISSITENFKLATYIKKSTEY